MDAQLQQMMQGMGGGGAPGGIAADVGVPPGSPQLTSADANERQRRDGVHFVPRAAQGAPPVRSDRADERQMLKHGRAGVPLEVMGLMLGEFVDEFTVRVIGA